MIVGTGGQGRECLDIALAMVDDGAHFNVVGFVDDNPSPIDKQLVEQRGFPILGTVESLLGSPRGADVCIGIGSGNTRRHIDRRLRGAGVTCPVLLHPSSTVGSQVRLGEGSTIWAGARLTTHIQTGRHVHINQNATIGHDSTLADYATVHPQAAISGNVRLEAASTVGASATVLPGLEVGAGAIVGAGAVVVLSVEASRTVKGVPAR